LADCDWDGQDSSARHARLLARMMAHLRSRLGDAVGDYAFPPPVFVAMQGALVALDLEEATLSARFPVRADTLNPYGSMQGGMIAAAVDNTVGPLSMLLAPHNVTRRLELVYSRPATLEMGHIVVSARLVERRRRQMVFRADVRTPEGQRLARAKAIHWVLPDRLREGEAHD
jgi:uncharacterized protein (TIGR00369 family)